MNANISLPKVLIVEDNKGWHVIFSEKLSTDAEIIYAVTPSEAIEIIKSEPNLSAIAVDGSLMSLNDGAAVVQFARQFGFKGPIIATAGVIVSDALLMEAGASEKTDKVFFVKYMKQLLAHISVIS